MTSAIAEPTSKGVTPALEVATELAGTRFPATSEAPENIRELRLQARDERNALGEPWPSPENDRLLRAARGEEVDRPPKWMMRQAGRYLPEYRAVLQYTDFFSVCKSPSLAAEITLQPYRRYPSLDSLIIFSDILVIPSAMGMGLSFGNNSKPRFDFALHTPEDMKRLDLKPDVQESL